MKITIIGAGSHFTLALLRAIYQSANPSPTMALMDIRQPPLDALTRLINRLNALTGKQVAFSVHQNRDEALEGADHVLASFAVDFPDAFLRTTWVLENHGIHLTEAETATPGGLLATLRHTPPLLAIAGEARALCPGAWIHIINNPMPRLVNALLRRAGYPRVIGHCHGTIDSRDRLAQLLDVPSGEIDLFVAGINHSHILQSAVHTPSGRDVLDALRRLSDAKIEEWKRADFSQWKMWDELDCFLGPGLWHTFDYCPYANHRLYRVNDWNTWPRACLMGRTVKPYAGEAADSVRTDDEARKFLAQHEREQIYSIMCALSGVTGEYRYLSGNLPNEGQIAQLPEGAIVELPAVVTRDKITLEPVRRPLPEFYAAWLRTQITIHELSAEAAVNHSRRAAIEAIAADPSFRDCDCSPGTLLDEMLAVNQGLVPTLT
jgi:alpha-galactosidase